MEIIVHDIAKDGLPDMDNLTGRVAFIFDGCIVSGWPLDDGESWEANSDVGRHGKFSGVTHWVEFPAPVWELHATQPEARAAKYGKCDLSVGCDEAGVCYALANGHPEQCGRGFQPEARGVEGMGVFAPSAAYIPTALPIEPGAKVEWDGTHFVFSRWHFDGKGHAASPLMFVDAVLNHIRSKCEELAANSVRADGLIGFSQPGSAIRTVRDLPAEQPKGKGDDPGRMAIRLLVAAGHVTEAKANEALCIAHGFEPGPLAPAAPVGVDEWRSIESAPRDGTIILIGRPGARFAEDLAHVAAWETDPDYPSGGHWMIHDGKTDHPLRGAMPTVWQPIKPPAALAGKEGAK